MWFYQYIYVSSNSELFNVNVNLLLFGYLLLVEGNNAEILFYGIGSQEKDIILKLRMYGSIFFYFLLIYTTSIFIQPIDECLNFFFRRVELTILPIFIQPADECLNFFFRGVELTILLHSKCSYKTVGG